MSATVSAIKPNAAPSPDPVEIARELARDFATRAAEYDRSGDFPHDNIAALHKAGLLALLIAKDHGGLGANLETAQKVVSEIAVGDPSTALILTMHYTIHGVINQGRWPEALAARVLAASRAKPVLVNNAQAEPGMGSPAHGGLPETIAHIEGDHWVINGHKSFVTGLAGLTWAVVLALTTEEVPRLIQVLVPLDAPGIRKVRTWEAAGMYSTASDDLLLESVRVPLSDLIFKQPASEPLRRDPDFANTFFTLLSSVYHGVALSARNDLLKHLTSHAPTSLGAPLASIPRLQEGVGQIEVLLATNARLLRSLARDVDQKTAGPTDALAVRHVVIDNAVTVTDLALEYGGNRGLRRDYHLERHHRDAITARAHAPQSHMIRSIFGKAALERAATTP
ncbi:acyl-CoA dehydrogenase [Agrobacterium vitis]|uniref:acyl-CoA dehydrogenase family protein n=1 Tax=Allorhizobium ampelinum TaxID=3025782 RepID=UPI001F2AC55E|nr:acyl-CoA dehydrogenase family protein [Allorhizobium ampelinum]MCF1462027.1 acyl-CoA dehydrogenase [Allorhizobium ampelinum]